MSDTIASPHAPHLQYNCDDYDCCDNGCPVVTCRACGRKWPCPDWRSRHTEAQVLAQCRYVARKWWRNDPDMVEYSARRHAETGHI